LGDIFTIIHMDMVNSFVTNDKETTS